MKLLTILLAIGVQMSWNTVQSQPLNFSLFLDSCNNTKCKIMQNGAYMDEAPFDCVTHIYDGKPNKNWGVKAQGPAPSNTSELHVNATYVTENVRGCETKYTAYVYLPSDGSAEFLKAYLLSVFMLSDRYKGLLKQHLVINISSNDAAVFNSNNTAGMSIMLPCFETLPAGFKFDAYLITFSSGYQLKTPVESPPLVYNYKDGENKCTPLPTKVPSQTTTEDSSSLGMAETALIITVTFICVALAFITICLVWRKIKSMTKPDPSGKNDHNICDGIIQSECSLTNTTQVFSHIHAHTNRSASMACTQCQSCNDWDTSPTKQNKKNSACDKLGVQSFGHSWFDERDHDGDFNMGIQRYESGYDTLDITETIEC